VAANSTSTTVRGDLTDGTEHEQLLPLAAARIRPVDYERNAFAIDTDSVTVSVSRNPRSPIRS
jgi:hypothetical protein